MGDPTFWLNCLLNHHRTIHFCNHKKQYQIANMSTVFQSMCGSDHHQSYKAFLSVSTIQSYKPVISNQQYTKKHLNPCSQSMSHNHSFHTSHPLSSTLYFLFIATFQSMSHNHSFHTSHPLSSNSSFTLITFQSKSHNH